MLIQNAIKISLKCSLELHFELCAQSVIPTPIIGKMERLLILSPSTRPTSFRVSACEHFALRQAVQNAPCSLAGGTVFVIRGACVVPHISIRCIYYCWQRPLVCAVRDRWR